MATRQALSSPIDDLCLGAPVPHVELRGRRSSNFQRRIHFGSNRRTKPLFPLFRLGVPAQESLPRPVDSHYAVLCCDVIFYWSIFSAQNDASSHALRPITEQATTHAGGSPFSISRKISRARASSSGKTNKLHLPLSPRCKR